MVLINSKLFRKVFWALVINCIIVVYIIVRTATISDIDLTDANIRVSEIQLASFKNACKSYLFKTGVIPTKLRDLVHKPSNINNWRQMLEQIPEDPWGNKYIYIVKNNCIEIKSLGETADSEDDISILWFWKNTLSKKLLNNSPS